MAKSEIEKFFSDDDFLEGNTELIAGDGWESATDNESEQDGQLSIDMYETKKDLVIKAPVAGVKKGDLEVGVTDDMLHITGKRERELEKEVDGFLVHECYWGSFSRTQSLPIRVDSDKAKASLKDGILTITIPKVAGKTKGRPLTIE